MNLTNNLSTNPTTANNPLAIDMSRLRRKPVDLKTVTRPRFLLPGWKFMSNGAEVTEQEWNTLPAKGKYLYLDRKSVNTRNASITVFFTAERKGYTINKPAWLLTCDALQNHTHEWQEVYFGTSVTADVLVRAVEQFILLAHERTTQGHADLFTFHGGSRNSRQDWFGYTRYVDNVMKLWRDPMYVENKEAMEK